MIAGIEDEATGDLGETRARCAAARLQREGRRHERAEPLPLHAGRPRVSPPHRGAAEQEG